MYLPCFDCNKAICKQTCMKCRDILKFELVEYLLGVDLDTATHQDIQEKLKLLQTTQPVSNKLDQPLIVYLDEDSRNKDGRPTIFNLSLTEVLTKYVELGSYRKVAKFYTCSDTYIRNLINPQKHIITLTECQKQEILSIYNQYGSLRKAAANYKCSHTHFKKLLDVASRKE